MSAKLDAIIFGASGFSGKIAVEDAVEGFKDLKWGIAGRNMTKLKEVLKDVGEKLSRDLSNIPIIIADINDEKSIEEMANKCKIILNCCGPYRFYGEVVVKACIAAGTHHVDISGEPQYINQMQLKYDAQAQDQGVYVVSTCGFDCIPNEMGVLYVEKNFPGTLNSVESYWENFIDFKDSFNKTVLHYGTWESLVYAMKNTREILQLQKELNKEELPVLKPKLRMKPYIQKPDFLESYFIPLPFGDKDIVERTQRLLYKWEKKRPIQFQNYVGFKSFKWPILAPLLLIIYTIMTLFSLTRKLLLKYPNFFTCGLVSHSGPTQANLDNLYFRMTFKAAGWSKGHSLDEQPDKEIMARVSCNNPFYGLTGLGMIAAARTILQESDKMPGRGGVLPPGAAFANTKLIETLTLLGEKYALKFELLN